MKRLRSRRRGKVRRSTPKKSAPPIRVEKAQTKPPADNAHFMALSSRPRRSSRLEAHPKRRPRPRPCPEPTDGWSEHNHPLVLTTDHRFLGRPTAGQIGSSDNRPAVHNQPPIGPVGSDRTPERFKKVLLLDLRFRSPAVKRKALLEESGRAQSKGSKALWDLGLEKKLWFELRRPRR